MSSEERMYRKLREAHKSQETPEERLSRKLREAHKSGKHPETPEERLSRKLREAHKSGKHPETPEERLARKARETREHDRNRDRINTNLKAMQIFNSEQPRFSTIIGGFGTPVVVGNFPTGPAIPIIHRGGMTIIPHHGIIGPGIMSPRAIGGPIMFTGHESRPIIFFNGVRI